MNIYKEIEAKVKTGRKLLFLLIDPDKFVQEKIKAIQQNNAKLDAILVGGSLTFNPIGTVIEALKKDLDIPVIIFPGNSMQVSEKADAIFFLSLMSGRNPDFLIGNHVLSAPEIEAVNLETIPVAYLLVEGGQVSSVQYMSNTTPIPYNKSDIAVATALAAKFLGMKMIYLEAGSGALRTISDEMIRNVKEKTGLPLIVGGGIKSAKRINEIYNAGADIVVIGNQFETSSNFLTEL